MAQTDYLVIHDAACARGETTYLDPASGLMVFTRLGLLARGRCCGAGCRHCPFEHQAVPLEHRSRRIQQAAWLSEARPRDGARPVVLFWSGGKDSFLALRALEGAGAGEIILLSCFDAARRMIEHQEIAIEQVIAQARALGRPLIGVPLHPGGDYLAQILPALDLAGPCERLAFGDLKSEAIRTWREETLGAHERTGALTLEFPLWRADYDALFGALSEALEATGAQCVISAVSPAVPGIAVGERFDRALAARLPEGVDRFGANGEFFTRMVFSG